MRYSTILPNWRWCWKVRTELPGRLPVLNHPRNWSIIDKWDETSLVHSKNKELLTENSEFVPREPSDPCELGWTLVKKYKWTKWDIPNLFRYAEDIIPKKVLWCAYIFALPSFFPASATLASSFGSISVSIAIRFLFGPVCYVWR